MKRHAPESAPISAAPSRAPILVAAAAAVAITLPWFLAKGYIFMTDFVWGPHSEAKWTDGGGPLRGLMSLLGQVISPAFVEKSVIAGTLFLLVFAGMRLAAALSDDKRVVIVAGLFFLFNPFVYDRLGYGQIYVLLGLGFFILGTADLLAHLLRDKGKAAVIRAGLWFGLAMQFAPHFAFFSAVIGAAWLAAEVARTGRRAKRLILPLVIAITITGAVNLNWLAAPGGVGGHLSKIGTADLAAFQTAGKDGGEALTNVLMMSGFWGKDQMRYADLTAFKENWGRSFFFLLPLMLWGAYEGLRDKRRRPLAVGLAVAWLLSVVLAVGIRLPLARQATEWLFFHLPFYRGLRETQKWVAVEVVCYGVFLAWGIERLFKAKLGREHGRLFAVLLFAIVVLQAPLMLWGMNGTIRPVPYPADWQQADALTRPAGECRGKILFLPWHLYLSFGWSGVVSAVPARDFFTCPVIQGSNIEWASIYDDSGDAQSAAVEQWLASKGASDLLTSGAEHISYVILAKEADSRQYGWLDTLSDVRLIADSATLKVYEVTAGAKDR